MLYIQDELGDDPVSDITLVLDNNNMFMFPMVIKTTSKHSIMKIRVFRM